MNGQSTKMRLLTRSDFDGLVCAVLLKELQLIDSYKFVHPKDMQDGKIQVEANDVLANVPYVPGCGLWFDHHLSEQKRNQNVIEFKGSFKEAPSCARVIWDYYGGQVVFGARFNALMEAVDRCDSGQLTVDDIDRPRDWVLLSYVMDPRTGLGRYRDYRISNYELMEQLVDYCRTLSIDKILSLPDVQERLARYHEQTILFREMIAANTKQQGNVVIVDLRNQEEIYAGNRFVLYTMFPTANISAQIMWGFQKQNMVITCGHSIINRTSKTDVGALMFKYGGGGHRAVGTCQVPVEEADAALAEIVAQMNADG
jgi:nanoRNase/pAp phosphatase (c-di-AMP/oligoRNAs hydrolase)